MVKPEEMEQIERLYMEMYKKMLSYAMTVLQDHAEAEEAVQDAFRIACSKPKAVLSSQNPQGWMMNALKNVLRNIRRAKAVFKKMQMQLLSTEGLALKAENDEIDFRLIHEDLLGEEDFRLLTMVVLEKYTMREAAKALGISVEACKKRVQRAKKKFKKILEEMNETDVPE